MNQVLRFARFAAALVIVALLGAACAPLPPPFANPPGTVSVFVPQVGAGPGAVEQPTATTAEATATVVATATLAFPTVTPLPTDTPWPTPTEAPTLVGPLWEWVTSAFKDGTVLAPGDPTRYSFQLMGDGNAVVQADCNFGAATWQESGTTLFFGAIGTTKMACPPDSLDSAFLAQLNNVASYALGEGELVLKLKDGAGTMRLRAGRAEVAAGAGAGAEMPAATPSPAPLTPPTVLPTDTPWPTVTATPPTPMLAGTPVALPTRVGEATVIPSLNGSSWVLVSLTVGRQAIPPVGQTPITLEIAADGSQIAGSTGCNEYRATLGRDAAGGALVGPALTTRKACSGEIMIQEVQVMDALLRARSYVVQGNELTLIDASGNALLVFVRKQVE